MFFFPLGVSYAPILVGGVQYKSPDVQIDSVTTKGGVTETILLNLEKKGIKRRFEDSLQKGFSKIQAIKTQLVVNKFSDRI